MSRFAETVEIPRTVPSSATQNSATDGQPWPAMGSSWSQPGSVKAAAEWIDSGWVEVGRPGGQVEDVGGGTVLARLPLADRGEQPGGTEVVIDPGSHSRSCFACLDHVFDCRRRVRQ